MSRILAPVLAATLCMLSSTAHAHFGMVIPSREIVADKKSADIRLNLSFSHPMEGSGMVLDKPAAFYVVMDGEKMDLAATLHPATVYEHQAWSADYAVSRPGLYQFVMEPAPYWEPAEDCFIIHYTKTYVTAFGGEEGWDEPIGLKTEIVPLTRPFGNYTGNLFQGQVLLDGKAVPGALVEVEYFNQKQDYQTPNDVFITQVVKADANGVFSYSVPFAGWWGFAALSTAKEKIEHEGNPKEVELGAVLWSHFVDPVHK